MICKDCGAKIEGLTRICPHCGERAHMELYWGYGGAAQARNAGRGCAE